MYHPSPQNMDSLTQMQAFLDVFPQWEKMIEQNANVETQTGPVPMGSLNEQQQNSVLQSLATLHVQAQKR